MIRQVRRGTTVLATIDNYVGYRATKELMEVGAATVRIGADSGAVGARRETLRAGVREVAAMTYGPTDRDDYCAATVRYVPVITDGGMRTDVGYL